VEHDLQDKAIFTMRDTGCPGQVVPALCTVINDQHAKARLTNGTIRFSKDDMA